jgi:protocatechuate 3,4-dioxygenase beta subunit
MKTFRSVVVLLLAVASSGAQTGTTSVRGVVLDKTGAAIADARVSIINNGQALQRETRTDNSGEYRLLALPPGNYTLTVEKGSLSKRGETHRSRPKYDSPTTDCKSRE